MTQPVQTAAPTVQRRRFFAGAGAVGALAAVAALGSRPSAPEVQATVEPLPSPERGGGYALTERVKKYYETTRV